MTIKSHINKTLKEKNEGVSSAPVYIPNFDHMRYILKARDLELKTKIPSIYTIDLNNNEDVIADNPLFDLIDLLKDTDTLSLKIGILCRIDGHTTPFCIEKIVPDDESLPAQICIYHTDSVLMDIDQGGKIKTLIRELSKIDESIAVFSLGIDDTQGLIIRDYKRQSDEYSCAVFSLYDLTYLLKNEFHDFARKYSQRIGSEENLYTLQSLPEEMMVVLQSLDGKYEGQNLIRRGLRELNGINGLNADTLFPFNGEMLSINTAINETIGAFGSDNNTFSKPYNILIDIIARQYYQRYEENSSAFEIKDLQTEYDIDLTEDKKNEAFKDKMHHLAVIQDDIKQHILENSESEKLPDSMRASSALNSANMVDQFDNNASSVTQQVDSKDVLEDGQIGLINMSFQDDLDTQHQRDAKQATLLLRKPLIQTIIREKATLLNAELFPAMSKWDFSLPQATLQELIGCFVNRMVLEKQKTELVKTWFHHEYEQRALPDSFKWYAKVEDQYSDRWGFDSSTQGVEYFIKNPRAMPNEQYNQFRDLHNQIIPIDKKMLSITTDENMLNKLLFFIKHLNDPLQLATILYSTPTAELKVRLEKIIYDIIIEQFQIPGAISNFGNEWFGRRTWFEVISDEYHKRHKSEFAVLIQSRLDEGKYITPILMWAYKRYQSENVATPTMEDGYQEIVRFAQNAELHNKLVEKHQFLRKLMSDYQSEENYRHKNDKKTELEQRFRMIQSELRDISKSSKFEAFFADMLYNDRLNLLHAVQDYVENNIKPGTRSNRGGFIDHFCNSMIQQMQKEPDFDQGLLEQVRIFQSGRYDEWNESFKKWMQKIAEDVVVGSRRDSVLPGLSWAVGQSASHNKHSTTTVSVSSPVLSVENAHSSHVSKSGVIGSPNLPSLPRISNSISSNLNSREVLEHQRSEIIEKKLAGNNNGSDKRMLEDIEIRLKELATNEVNMASAAAAQRSYINSTKAGLSSQVVQSELSTAPRVQHSSDTYGASSSLSTISFIEDLKSARQDGNSCGFIALDIERNDVVQYINKNIHEKKIRQLLLPEIRIMCAIECTIFQRDRTTTSKVTNRLSELQSMVLALNGTAEVEVVYKEITRILATEPSSTAASGILLHGTKKEEVLRLFKVYEDTTANTQSQLNQINDKLGFTAGKRRNYDELLQIFSSNNNPNGVSKEDLQTARNDFEQAKKAINLAQENLDEVLLQPEVALDYVNNYYGKNGWLAFQPNVSGGVNSSVVDVIAMQKKCQIVIWQSVKGEVSKLKILYNTANCSIDNIKQMHIRYNGSNHFTALVTDLPCIVIDESINAVLQTVPAPSLPSSLITSAPQQSNSESNRSTQHVLSEMFAYIPTDPMNIRNLFKTQDHTQYQKFFDKIGSNHVWSDDLFPNEVGRLFESGPPGKQIQTITMLEKFVSQESNKTNFSSVYAHMLLANIYYNNAQPNKAREYLLLASSCYIDSQTFVKQPMGQDHLDMYYMLHCMLADVFEDLGEYELASQYLKQAINKMSYNLDLCGSKDMALQLSSKLSLVLLNLGKTAEGLLELEQIEQKYNLNDAAPEHKHNILFNFAIAHNQNKQYPKAISCIERIKNETLRSLSNQEKLAFYNLAATIYQANGNDKVYRLYCSLGNALIQKSATPSLASISMSIKQIEDAYKATLVKQSVVDLVTLDKAVAALKAISSSLGFLPLPLEQNQLSQIYTSIFNLYNATIRKGITEEQASTMPKRFKVLAEELKTIVVTRGWLNPDPTLKLILITFLGDAALRSRAAEEAIGFFNALSPEQYPDCLQSERFRKLGCANEIIAESMVRYNNHMLALPFYKKAQECFTEAATTPSKSFSYIANGRKRCEDKSRNIEQHKSQYENTNINAAGIIRLILRKLGSTVAEQTLKIIEEGATTYPEPIKITSPQIFTPKEQKQLQYGLVMQLQSIIETNLREKLGKGLIKVGCENGAVVAILDYAIALRYYQTEFYGKEYPIQAISQNQETHNNQNFVNHSRAMLHSLSGTEQKSTTQQANFAGAAAYNNGANNVVISTIIRQIDARVMEEFSKVSSKTGEDEEIRCVFNMGSYRLADLRMYVEQRFPGQTTLINSDEHKQEIYLGIPLKLISSLTPMQQNGRT